VSGFHPKDYPADEAMVPHGMSVALTAPEAFRFTFDAGPERHVRAAQLLAPGAERPPDDAEFLPRVLTDLMRDIEIPSGVAAVGYSSGDIPALVEGTLKQQRLLASCPKPVTEDDLGGIFERSLELW
jgi:hydroxyacid-oxoacid transhydrogenase